MFPFRQIGNEIVAALVGQGTFGGSFHYHVDKRKMLAGLFVDDVAEKVESFIVFSKFIKIFLQNCGFYSEFQHVDAGLEFLAGAHRVDVVIELLDTATLELTVQSGCKNATI